MKYSLFSHPEKLLRTHLISVYETGMNNFYKHSVFAEYEEILKIALLFHDLGKASSFFQDYILNQRPVNERFKKHSEISAVWAYIYLKKYLNKSDKEAIIAYILIRKHHGNFDNFRDNLINDLDTEDLITISSALDYQELNGIYDDYLNGDLLTHSDFQRYSNEIYPLPGRIARNIVGSLSLNDYYILNYLFSILISADKADTIFENYNNQRKTVWKAEFVNKYKSELPLANNSIDRLRNITFSEAEDNLNCSDRILSLNIPTGSGKTLNVLNIALKIKEADASVERIIYCLPFTSIIDQISGIFEDILSINNININSDILLKHHHLSELSYHNDSEDYTLQEENFLIETWESEMVLTTFFQMMHTLLSNRNRALKKFHNIANSVIILDEVQAIPHKYWLMIKKILIHCTQCLNTRIILVTATLPMIFDENKKEVYELIKNKQQYFNQMNRIELDLSYLQNKLLIDDFVNILKNNILQSKDKSHLIICNTIKTAQEIFQKLQDEYSEDTILLTTLILPLHRARKIKQIKKCPGRKIIVSTQLIEAGVDIDIDFVYRDFAPLDSVFQACGRCNRNNSKTRSKVFLLELINEKEISFHSYIYDSVLTFHTRKCLKDNKIIPEKEFLNLAYDYYKGLNNILSNDISINILDNLKKLNYGNVFDLKNSDHQHFLLIDSYKTVSTFIEYDENAKLIYSDFLNFLKTDMDPYEKRINLKKIFRKMAPYILNLSEKLISEKTEFFYINNESMNSFYSEKTGFKTQHQQEDYIL